MWFLSGFPNFEVRNLAAVGRDVFQRGAVVVGLVSWACAVSL